VDAHTADANDRPTALDDVRRYIDSSPSPFHAAATTTERLRRAGFAELDLADDWGSLPGSGYVVDGGAVVAWRVGSEASEHSPFRLAGAHTDSPCLRVKPNPDHESVGWRQLNVEVYGGILNNSWLDRDLAVAGRVIAADGHSTLFDSGRPVARVPQLAVHLDRAVNDGLTLDPQQHLRPVWGVGSSSHDEFAEWLAAESGVDRPEFWDLCLYDAQPAAVLGVDASMLASGRLDNLLSCWAATTALIAADPTDVIAAVVLNDHEEVGSASSPGTSARMPRRRPRRNSRGLSTSAERLDVRVF
jgi:aspartyl aminopeptidase